MEILAVLVILFMLGCYIWFGYSILRLLYSWLIEPIVDAIKGRGDARKTKIIQNIKQFRFRYPNGYKEYIGDSDLSNKTLRELKSVLSLCEASAEKMQQREDELNLRQEKNRREYSIIEAWHKRQQEFASKSRNLSPDSWGCYYYDIQIEGVDEIGNKKDYSFKVWQHFSSSYCRDASLDYSYYKSYKDNCAEINLFKLKQRYRTEEFYDKVLDVIKSLSDNIVVLFSGSGNLSDITSFPDSLNAFHFEYLREQLDKEGIPHYEIDYDTYNLGDEQDVVIVELDTTNSRLQLNCEHIFNNYKKKKPCITYISLFKEFTSKEMSDLIKERERTIKEQEEKQKVEAERKRREEERKKQEAERQRTITNSLKSAVSSWGNVPNSELHHEYLIRYYPTTCDFDATDSEWNDRQLIWSFKNDPNKETRISHQQALNNLIPRVKNRLESTFGNLLPNLTLVCIPASSPEKNKARYELFSELLCRGTGMSNAYSHITINSERTARHEGGAAGGTDSILFDEAYFKGKNILLFDDVLTRGDSMRKFKSKLSALGANVIAGFTIGRTFHNREVNTLSYRQSSSNLNNDHLDDLPF